MDIQYKSEAWQFFVANARADQPAVGSPPAVYAGRAGFPDSRLSSSSLSRAEVLQLCQAKGADPWIGFVSVMAWGAQDRMPGGKTKVEAMFAQQDKILAAIDATKSAASRNEAFEIWAKSDVKHLWVAYFTKLLFFFLYPGLHCYVMDQWTAKSVNLLCGEKLISRKHLGQRTAAQSAGQAYEQYCDLVDQIAVQLSSDTRRWTGMEAETALFCQGGRDTAKDAVARAGPWRLYVRNNIGSLAP